MARIFTTALGSTHELRLDITQSSQSVSGNSSVISYNLYIQRTASNTGAYWSNYTSTFSLTINGTAIHSGASFTYDFRSSNTKTLATGTRTIPHNSDGKKTFSSSASVNPAGLLASGSGSGNMTLTTIPRASSFTLSGGTTTGSAITITISRATSSFTHTIRWRIGSGSWVSHASGVATSSSLTVPHSAIPSAESGTLTVEVQTMSGRTKIGDAKTLTRALTIPTNIVPTIGTITHVETVSAVSTLGAGYIQSKSKIKIAVSSIAAGSGSAIKSATIALAGNGSGNITASNREWTTGFIQGSGNRIATVTVTDNRGRSSSKTINISTVAYAPPKLNTVTIDRATGTTIDPMGTSLRVAYTASATSLSDKNTLSLVIKTRAAGTGSYTTKGTYTGNPQTATRVFTGYPQTQAYDVQIVLTDKFETVTIDGVDMVLPTAGVPFFVGSNELASSFGKIPTHGTTYDLEIGDKGLRVDGQIIDKNGNEVLATHTHSASDITSGTIADARLPAKAKPNDFVVEEGSNYTKWNSGRFEQWGTATFRGKTVVKWGNMYVDSTSYQVDFPIAFVGTPYVIKEVRSTGGVSVIGVSYSNPSITNTYFKGGMNPMRPDNNSNVPFAVAWYAIGKWK